MSAQLLEFCLQLGVQVVTVYAFSIENFHRSEEEVGFLGSWEWVSLEPVPNIQRKKGSLTEKFSQLPIIPRQLCQPPRQSPAVRLGGRVKATLPFLDFDMWRYLEFVDEFRDAGVEFC